MDVKIKTTCGRCGRENLVDMELQEAAKLEEKDNARVEAEKDLPEVLNNVLGDEYPDIIIATRGEDGNYSVKTLHGLCVTAGKSQKGCKARVQNLMYELFMEKDPNKPARKKKPADPKPEDKDEAKTDEAKTDEAKTAAPKKDAVKK